MMLPAELRQLVRERLPVGVADALVDFLDAAGSERAGGEGHPDGSRIAVSLAIDRLARELDELAVSWWEP